MTNILSKYDDIIQSLPSDFGFSFVEKDCVCKLIKEKDTITETELINMLNHYHTNTTILPLIIQNKTLSMKQIEKFILTHTVSQQLCFELAKRDDIDGNVIYLLDSHIDSDSLNKKLFKYLKNKEKGFCNTFHLRLSETILSGKSYHDNNTINISFINNEDLIKNYLEKEKEYFFTNAITDKIHSAIANNIFIDDKLREKAFDRDCDYNDIINPTEYMKQQMYQYYVETCFNYNENDDKFEKATGYEKLLDLIQLKLNDECEIDLLNRIINKEEPQIEHLIVLKELLKNTNNINLFKILEKNDKLWEFAYEIQDYIKDNEIKRQTIMMLGNHTIEKIKASDNKNDINSKEMRQIIKASQNGILLFKTYYQLLSLKNPTVELLLSYKKTTPERFLRIIYSNALKREDNLTSLLARINIATKNAKLNKRELDKRDKFLSFILDMKTIGHPMSENCFVIEDEKELDKIKKIFDYVENLSKDEKEFCEKCKNELDILYIISKKNREYNPEINTTYYLKRKKKEILLNNKNKTKVELYLTIDEIKEQINEIEKELNTRKEKEMKEREMQERDR